MIIGICDDNDLHLDYVTHNVSNLLSNTKDVTIESLTPEQLDKKLNSQSFHYDIFITDIDMGAYNGIDFVNQINQINSSCIIIFISSYLNYASDVYDVQHIYFILKSEIETRLQKALDKALLVYKNHKDQFINFRYQNVDYRLPMDHITHIEAMGRYLHIHDTKNSYTTIKSLKSQQEELSEQFIQCHKSYIVNMDFIQSISRTDCILMNGDSIPISKTYLKNFKTKYISHLSSKLT